MTAPVWRSLLFVPGTRAAWFVPAIASGADAVIFDLEDAVAAEAKARARDAVGAYVAAMRDEPRPSCLVRVNAVGSPWWEHDVAMAVSAGADGIVVPKVESRRDLRRVGRLSEVGGRAAAGPWLVPIVETARGVLAAGAVARALPGRIPALVFGAEDLTAEIGIPRTPGGRELLFARSQVVLAAASAKAFAVDTVVTNLDDDAALADECARARALGFGGKLAIHPRQVRIINAAFTPSLEEIAAAEAVVSAFAGVTPGEGVVRAGAEMIDAPVVQRARRVLARASSSSRPQER